MPKLQAYFSVYRCLCRDEFYRLERQSLFGDIKNVCRQPTLCSPMRLIEYLDLAHLVFLYCRETIFKP